MDSGGADLKSEALLNAADKLAYVDNQVSRVHLAEAVDAAILKLALILEIAPVSQDAVAMHLKVFDLALVAGFLLIIEVDKAHLGLLGLHEPVVAEDDDGTVANVHVAVALHLQLLRNIVREDVRQHRVLRQVVHRLLNRAVRIAAHDVHLPRVRLVNFEIPDLLVPREVTHVHQVTDLLHPKTVLLSIQEVTTEFLVIVLKNPK